VPGLMRVLGSIVQSSTCSVFDRRHDLFCMLPRSSKACRSLWGRIAIPLAAFGRSALLPWHFATSEPNIEGLPILIH
jgi:hypothetical protein